MEKKIRLLPPMMPNCVRMDTPYGKSQHFIDVASFTRKEAEEYGELMKQEFIKHWEKRKRNKIPT